MARKRQSTESSEYDAGDTSHNQEHTKKRRIDLSHSPTSTSTPSKAMPIQKTKSKQGDEKRLRRWRSRPPSSYIEIRDRAMTQRMYLLDRERHLDDLDDPYEVISLAGTTGNVYSVVIGKVPHCNCPHALKGNQCKHICYIISRVLRVRGELEYQLAFTVSELRHIFANAPPLPSDTSRNEDGNRKPIDGECPICMVDFEPGGQEEVVYCRAACGNNIHQTCFQKWAASKTGGQVTCPFCRTPWSTAEIGLKAVGSVNEEGYVNIASQLGISVRRDYSSYHSNWVRRQANLGVISWDDDGVINHTL